LTLLGAAFIWFTVPETKRLSLEEMDIIFGSEGAAQRDQERMTEINNEIGLTAIMYGGSPPSPPDYHRDEKLVVGDEKAVV
jgi:hypothetical protein